MIMRSPFLLHLFFTAAACAAAVSSGCSREGEAREPTDAVPETVAAGADTAPANPQKRPRTWVDGMAGRWVRAPERDELSAEQLAAAKELEAIGYAGGYEPGAGLSGVVHDEPERRTGGYNLYCSGHGPEAILMDMQGRTLHSWRFAYEDVPDARDDVVAHAAGTWRRVHLYENGDLLAIFAGLGLLKVDADSELLWYDGNGAHHDLEVQPDGSIYVLTRQAGLREDVDAERVVLEDFVTVLSPEGEHLRSVSLLDGFLDSEWADWVEDGFWHKGDIFHTNTLEVLGDELVALDPAFAPGRVLVSLRHRDALAVLDMEQARVVWAKRGVWKRQHQPTVVEGGKLLLFDNKGYQSSSQVIEIDPASGEVSWAYRGEPPESFYSEFCGSNQRLSGGNTLITDSCSGRAFEVTRSGEKVWEFYSPHRAGEQGEFIAAIYELVRLPETFPIDWIAR